MKIIGFILSLVLGQTSLFATESIGYYTKGKIKQSQDIRHYQGSWHKLFQQRNKFYATDELLQNITDLSLYIEQFMPQALPLQLGDIAGKHGGKAYRHRSHQNGLDVDIVYLGKKTKIQPTHAKEWQERFTKGKKVSPNFDSKANWQVFTWLVQNTKVNRIFVDQAIKSNLCRYTSNNPEIDKAERVKVLRRLRPARHHKTHFHLRLTCPKGHDQCIEQGPPPSGSGCRSLALTPIEEDDI